MPFFLLSRLSGKPYKEELLEISISKERREFSVFFQIKSSWYAFCLVPGGSHIVGYSYFHGLGRNRKKRAVPMTLTSLKLGCKKGNAFTSRLKLWGKMVFLRFSLRFLACRTKGTGNLHLKRLLKACSLLLLLVTPVWSSPGATRETETQRFEYRYRNVRSSMAVSRTLSFLKGKLENQPSLLEKITKKMSNMDEEQARLIVSLCDRVTEAGETAGADAAFLLMTVLLILS